jgi:hypothetical protein
MSETTETPFFERFPMRRVREGELDAVLAEPADGLSVLFLWGRDCPNCDIAKGAMLLAGERVRWPGVRWLHDNVYEDPDMATRFGLHGIPAFFVFAGSRKLGRITSWPGADAFVRAIETQLAALEPLQR